MDLVIKMKYNENKIYCQCVGNFVKMFDPYEPVCNIMDPFEPYTPMSAIFEMLDHLIFLKLFDEFELLWTNFDHFELIWIILNHF